MVLEFSAAKTRPTGSEAVASAYAKPPLLLVSQRHTKKSATLPPPVKARLKSRSLGVRPPVLVDAEEVKVPLVLRTSEFCRNSKSIYESPLVLSRSAAIATQIWPLVSLP